MGKGIARERNGEVDGAVRVVHREAQTPMEVREVDRAGGGGDAAGIVAHGEGGETENADAGHGDQDHRR